MYDPVSEAVKLSRLPPGNPFGSQQIPEGEDVEFSRLDPGFGYDQGYTMDRQPWDYTSTQDISALKQSDGTQIAPDMMHLSLERNVRHDSGERAPLLRGEVLGDRFGSYVNLIEWTPEPGVVHSGGQGTIVRANQQPEFAKRGIDYYYGVISGSDLLDAAISRTKKAMYGG